MRAYLAGVDRIAAPGGPLSFAPPDPSGTEGGAVGLLDPAPAPLDTLTSFAPLVPTSTAWAVYSAQAAAPARTLLDILRQTTRRHPNAPAVDDGTTVLTYRALHGQIDTLRQRLVSAGIGAGDRVGIRVPSGTDDLYVAILAVLAAGAAYVPVDAEDPDERAELVFAEAGVCAVIGAHRVILRRGAPHGTPRAAARPGRRRVDHLHLRLDRQAQGRRRHPPQPPRRSSTPRPGFSCTTSRSAPATGCWPGCRWPSTPPARRCGWPGGTAPAWSPRPASLVRTGVDLGPWLVEQRITVVSTVPTLAALWPAEALDEVRLLIFGGEACPPELASGWPSRAARCGTPTARPRRPWSPAPPS